MALRAVRKKKIRLSKGVELPPCPALSLEQVFHTPGQAAAIRFFDPDSVDDYLVVREINKSKHVKQWMDSSGAISRSDYRDWAGMHPDSRFLFAVLNARGGLDGLDRIQGFVYIYSEREEKFRVKRMQKLGFLAPTRRKRHCLEVSFALRPPKEGIYSGSGLMSSGLRQGCLQVRMQLDGPQRPEILLFAFVDPKNTAAQRTLEASGFVRKGQMKYDWNSTDETYLYFLNWRRLSSKIREKLGKSP